MTAYAVAKDAVSPRMPPSRHLPRPTAPPPDRVGSTTLRLRLPRRGRKGRRGHPRWGATPERCGRRRGGKMPTESHRTDAGKVERRPTGRMARGLTRRGGWWHLGVCRPAMWMGEEDRWKKRKIDEKVGGVR